LKKLRIIDFPKRLLLGVSLWSKPKRNVIKTKLLLIYLTISTQHTFSSLYCIHDKREVELHCKDNFKTLEILRYI
jgi:hypothetical protein